VDVWGVYGVKLIVLVPGLCSYLQETRLIFSGGDERLWEGFKYGLNHAVFRFVGCLAVGRRVVGLSLEQNFAAALKSDKIGMMKNPSFRFPAWTIALALLGLSFASFGIFLPRLGFYWDDWETVLVGRLFPAAEYWTYFSSNRPTAALTYVALAPLLGFNPLHWQIFTFIIRWLSAVALFGTLSSIWQDRQRQAALVACLFLIYPVFTQQSIAMSYHHHWLQYLYYFLSLWLTIIATRVGINSRPKSILLH
jgi:hypothetical protein